MRTLKPALPTYAVAVHALMQEAASRIYSPMDLNDVEKAIDDGSMVLIFDDATLVGTLVYFEKDGHMWLDEFVVSDQHRGKGIGTYALEFILNAHECYPWQLITHPENPAARLYERHGFKRGAVIENYYGDGEQRMEMHREAV
jgi:ribosomal protein S18 acetylase RimI-like enzyme